MNVIIKVTRNCNLRCNYCNEWRNKQTVMNIEVLANIISKVLNCSSMKSVNFIWHGGEPLLCGQEYYKKILYIQEKCNKKNVKISNSIQTNGVLLNKSWIEFLKKYNFNIGLSLDGPRELHDEQRLMVDNTSAFDATMDAIKILQEYNVPYGILSVVTKKSLNFGAKKIFDFFIENNIKDFAFLQQQPKEKPIGECYTDDDFINIDNFNNFMKQIFDLWIDYDDTNIKIREFNSIITMLLGGVSSICTLGGRCIGRNIGIDTNGDIYHCDECRNDSTYKLGNIINDNLDEILTGNKIKKIIQNNRDRTLQYKGCKECKWSSMCHGGCPRATYVNSDLYNNYCEYSALFEHIHKEIVSRLEDIV